MKETELLENMRLIIEHEESAEEINSFVSDVRSGLSETMAAYNKSATLMLVLIATHYLSASGLASEVKLLGVDFPEDPIVLASILFFISLVFLRAMSLSYLRKFQRECYDWAKVLFYRKLDSKMGTTGLHELRLPSDPLLGADLLRFDTGLFERIVGTIVWNILSFMYVVLPTAYLIHYTRKAFGVFLSKSNYLGLSITFATLGILFLVWCVYFFHKKLR